MFEFLLLHGDGAKTMFDLVASCWFCCLVPQVTLSFTELSSVHLLAPAAMGWSVLYGLHECFMCCMQADCVDLTD